jgi:hypothetical protein
VESSFGHLLNWVTSVRLIYLSEAQIPQVENADGSRTFLMKRGLVIKYNSTDVVLVLGMGQGTREAVYAGHLCTSPALTAPRAEQSFVCMRSQENN